MSQQDNKEIVRYFYQASAADFKKIPGSPVAYWASQKLKESFESEFNVDRIAPPRIGMMTTDNERFLRCWSEIDFDEIGFGFESVEVATKSSYKWFPYNKGGGFRKWAGFQNLVVNWGNGGQEIATSGMTSFRGKDFYFKEGLTWSDVASGDFSCRYTKTGSIFDIKGTSAFPTKNKIGVIACTLNSRVGTYILNIFNPTMSYQSGDIRRVPLSDGVLSKVDIVNCLFDKLVSISTSDWNSSEISWDFISVRLLDSRENRLDLGYKNVRRYLLETTLEMQRLEEENNRIFIDAYGLQDELTPEVPLSEITLTCNPHYRYGGNLSDEEREARLQSDTIAELVSYAIGCMMGRYSLDREGLVYAHAGNVGFNDLVAEGAYKTFAADGDGILPLTSEHWFDDDVAARIKEFVRTVWGEEHLEENLQFIADSLCLSAIKPLKKSGETARETIRRYLSTQFFKDHLKTYKKRPIYWLFSSGKEKAFECLVYLHRYNEATLPRMRTEYVTPLLGQMAGRIERLRLQKVDAATAEAKRLDKEIDSLTKQLTELRAFDDQLKHYADMKITLDLDDGVKVNYGKFGNLLAEVKAITGDKGE